MRALAKDPADRPQSARAFLAELDAALRAQGEDPNARPPSGAGVSGEMAPVVQEGLVASPLTARALSRMIPTRAGVAVATSAAVVVSAGLFALTTLRPPPVAIARPKIGLLAAARRLALAQADATPAEPVPVVPIATAEETPGQPEPVPSAAASSSSEAEGLPPLAPASAIRRPSAGNRYKKFDH
jgi:serine/threonine-protein kinase